MKVNNLQGVAYRNTLHKNLQKPTFRGVLATIGNANKNAMQYLERGGFFAEFCLMDMCGMVLPRVYQGFQRNKEELGHLNYQAGMEEFLREFITGPSMFLIPIGAVILAGKMLGKGTQINFKLLNKFSDSFKELGAKVAKKALPKTRKEFAGKLFDKFFLQNPEKLKHTSGSTVKSLKSFKKDFVAFLTDGMDKNLSKVEKGQKLERFVDYVADINSAHFNCENLTAMKCVSKDKKILQTTASDFYKDARKYMEDVIPSAKLTFDEIKNVSSKTFNDVVNKITQLRTNGRELLCIGGTAALAAFLSIIPKIYQLSKKNPALNGLSDNNKTEVQNANTNR